MSSSTAEEGKSKKANPKWYTKFQEVVDESQPNSDFRKILE